MVVFTEQNSPGDFLSEPEQSGRSWSLPDLLILCSHYGSARLTGSASGSGSAPGFAALWWTLVLAVDRNFYSAFYCLFTEEIKLDGRLTLQLSLCVSLFVELMFV